MTSRPVGSQVFAGRGRSFSGNNSWALLRNGSLDEVAMGSSQTSGFTHTLLKKSLAMMALFIRNLDLEGILKLTSPFNLGNGMKWMTSIAGLVTHKWMQSTRKGGGLGFCLLVIQARRRTHWIGYRFSDLFCLLKLPAETLKHPVMCWIIWKITWRESELSFALVRAQGKCGAVVSFLFYHNKCWSNLRERAGSFQ